MRACLRTCTYYPHRHPSSPCTDLRPPHPEPCLVPRLNRPLLSLFFKPARPKSMLLSPPAGLIFLRRPYLEPEKTGFWPETRFFPGFDPGFSETGFCPRHENRVFSRFCSKTGFWAPKPGFERNREKNRFWSRFKTGFRFPVRVLGFFPVLPQNRVLGPKTGF